MKKISLMVLACLCGLLFTATSQATGRVSQRVGNFGHGHGAAHYGYFNRFGFGYQNFAYAPVYQVPVQAVSYGVAVGGCQAPAAPMQQECHCQPAVAQAPCPATAPLAYQAPVSQPAVYQAPQTIQYAPRVVHGVNYNQAAPVAYGSYRHAGQNVLGVAYAKNLGVGYSALGVGHNRLGRVRFGVAHQVFAAQRLQNRFGHQNQVVIQRQGFGRIAVGTPILASRLGFVAGRVLSAPARVAVGFGRGFFGAPARVVVASNGGFGRSAVVVRSARGPARAVIVQPARFRR